jgi:hypothetical protein
LRSAACRRHAGSEVAILFERVVDDPFQFDGQFCVDPNGDTGALPRMPSKITADVAPLNGWFPSRLAGTTPTKEIAAGVEFLPAGLFRRHIRDRAER